MRHRRIGATDLAVSEVGLAVGPLVAGPGARSDAEVANLLSAALDLGIGYFGATDSDDDGRAGGRGGGGGPRPPDGVPRAPPFGPAPPPRLGQPPRKGPGQDWSRGLASH